MPSTTTVIFDLGGVLIDWNPRHLYRKLFTDSMEMEDFLATVCTTDWNQAQDAGRPFAEGVALLSKQYPEWASEIDAYRSRWPEMLKGAIDGTVVILKELRAAGWPLYALSNWSTETWPHAQNRFEFLDDFDGMVISGFEGVSKPNEALYRRLLDRYALEPSGCLFIDDQIVNVEAARRLGIEAHHFSNPERLRQVLVDGGLLQSYQSSGA